MALEFLCNVNGARRRDITLDEDSRKQGGKKKEKKNKRWPTGFRCATHNKIQRDLHGATTGLHKTTTKKEQYFFFFLGVLLTTHAATKEYRVTFPRRHAVKTKTKRSTSAAANGRSHWQTTMICITRPPLECLHNLAVVYVGT